MLTVCEMCWFRNQSLLLLVDNKVFLAPAGFVLFTLGLVIFIPGFYYSRISYYAYKGHPGYSFDTIPAV